VLVLDSESPANTLAFTPDGTRLVVGRGDGHVEVWTVPGGERLHRWGPFSQPILELISHPGAEFVFVVAGSLLATVSLVTAEITDSVRTWGGFSRAIVSPDGARIIAATQRGEMCGMQFFVPPRDFEMIWQAELDRPHLCNFVGTGDRFVMIDRDGLHVRAAETGEVLSTVKYPSNYVMTTAVSPDGGRLAVMGYEKLYVWDTATWGKPARYACAGARRFGAMAFHPSRPLLAAIQTGQTLVKFFDTQTWKLAARFAWKLGEMRAVAFSPDGTLAAAGSVTGKIVIWDVDG
jgi:WD40 repeat protein